MPLTNNEKNGYLAIVMQAYLLPTYFLNFDEPEVKTFTQDHTRDQASKKENAVSLYYAIRDGWRYNPYQIAKNRSGFLASNILSRDFFRGGHCIDKALLLVACARHIGIPSRLHFANVKNHIGTEKLEKELGSSTLVFHGYAELFLEEKWVAATPAFNKGLCEKLKVAPLEFDGENDSVFQEYDKAGGRFMDYIYDYGPFADLPFDLMVSEWERYYPEFIKNLKN